MKALNREILKPAAKPTNPPNPVYPKCKTYTEVIESFTVVSLLTIPSLLPRCGKVASLLDRDEMISNYYLRITLVHVSLPELP